MDLPLLTQLYTKHVADLERRYAPILAAAGYDAVAIHSGSLQKRSQFDDQYWPLRPTPHFHHWVPISEADCVLLVRPGHAPLLLRLAVTSFWEKPAPHETRHFESVVNTQIIDAPERVKEHLPAARVAFIGEDLSRAALWGIGAEHVNPPSLVTPLDRLRVTKTPYEVLCLEEANRRAAIGHERLRRLFVDGGCSELELHLAYLSVTRQDNPETPYKNIVALDENAATLHHISYGRSVPARAASSLLVDAGATYQGYCSDITRTWTRGPADHATASAFRQLVDAMEAMQQRLCAEIRVDLPYEALHDEAHRQVGAILVETGLSRMSPEETVSSGVSRAFFPHGLGHSLGLQCHDVGCAQIKPRADNPFLRNTTTIAEGQVFTIEPGLYFIDGLLDPLRAGPHGSGVDWALVRALSEMGGIRIEDDVVVTGGSSIIRNLTREFLPLGGA